MRNKHLVLAVAASVSAGAVAAQTAEVEFGQFEYVNSCAACHGADGRGEGSIAPYLNVALPDLTQLQKNNGGVFPVSAVFEAINVGPEGGPHGSKDMPAWGMRLTRRAEDTPGLDAASYARLRVLALVEYLSTIQEN